MAARQQIPYGIVDFKRIRDEGYYYVDKTAYIRKMEARDSFVFFVRPRRMGKSLFVDTLRCYYDVNEKANFSRLFGDLDIGLNPTENANRYLVLTLDFSQVEFMAGETLEEKFSRYLASRMAGFVEKYRAFLPGLPAAFPMRGGADMFEAVVSCAGRETPIYLILDEYDNFTNTLLRGGGSEPYRAVTHGTGFYRSWFKAFKASCARIFMTGVSPVTLDDLTSGFNIAKNLSQHEDFNALLGFSEADCVKMFSDFKGTGKFTEGDPAAIVRAIKPWYDGYCFAPACVGRECVFNSDMVLYYLGELVATGHAPENLIDVNIRTDYEKLQLVADIQHAQARGNVEDVLPLTEEIATYGGLSFDLVESFPADRLSDVANFRSLFHYYGILSMAGRRKGMTFFKVPNVCVERQLFAYLREAYRRTRQPDWYVWQRLASEFAYDGAWRPFLERLAADFADTTPVRGGIQGEARIQGYMQAEFGHLKFFLMAPEMETARGFCDFALFPQRVHYGDAAHSYLIELKYAAKDAADAVLDAQCAEAKAQLARYRADRFVPALARGTTLHQIVFQFKGAALHRLEQISEEAL